ncbi:RIPOR family member 3 isoform X3 [Camarhynchus parvulus]|uniref:RIPOR family member 3 isoform X3 n=1 Tax=Geospiza parvula TaxID=87175 RepID=UPI001237E1BF|nr:RIPOR family member 3 isoform X3 [Camarhynchus parvulus]
MSVKLTFVSPGDGGGISRSCSFTGFSTVQSRKVGKSLSRSSVRSRMSLKPPKAYNSLQKGALVWDPKPLQVKKIFEALKKGLNEYLEAHQAELDYLSGRHKDTKRNSRLAFYYDLDKQIRSVERYIRKLEFHISKVEELYEAYCIQCRLRDGATNMKQAFSLSPATKASRESLVELYRNVQECTEDMCFIEGALEVHLGEFHVKMKGLVGFARLCPGDQYEVFVRLGRQKWRLRGKIETDDSQTWDEEEKIFIPNLHEKFEIKVTELRGLATILVGVVTCDSSSFFSPKPQAIVVDITELGTIKLRLEVLWNPFDTENLFLSPGSTAKFSVGSRKSSLYNWTPPNTPSFRERYYLLKTLHKHSSMESLMVETVLESFDFLNNDCSADELSLFGSVRTGSVSTYNDNVLQSLSCDTRAEAQDVTTGDENLDVLLVTHLRLCKGLLQKLRTPNVAQVLQESILEEVSEQTRVLGDVLDLSAEKIIQKAKKKKQYLKIWSDLAEPGSSILVTSAERFRHALKYTMMLKVKEKYPSHLETVLQRLLEQILTCDGLLPSSHFQTEPVTLFQFYRYLERHRVGSLEKHLAKLAKEVMLIEELQCPGRLKTLKRLKGKRLSRLQPLPRTLWLLGLLQLDENHRVGKAATACLARAGGSGSLRARAVLFYTDALSGCDTRLQQAACLALKNLRAVESIEQVAHLCQSETEEVRNAARETTLSFGERGRQAFEKMDRICCELRETAQEAEIEITVF